MTVATYPNPCCGCFGTVTAKLSSYDNHPVARRRTGVYRLALYRKKLGDLALEGDSGPWGRTTRYGQEASMRLISCLSTYCMHGAHSRGAELWSCL